MGVAERGRVGHAVTVVLAAQLSLLAPVAVSGAAAQSTETPAISDALVRRLEALAAEYIEGATPVTDFRVGELQDEERRYHTLSGLQPDSCYIVMAVAEDRAADLDLHLYAGGVALGSDVDTNHAPVITWCNQAQSSISVELRMYSGEGRYVWQAWSRERTAVYADDPLGAALHSMAGRFTEGHLPYGAPIRDFLSTGGASTLKLQLVDGHCYVVTGAGAPTVTDLDLVLLADHGGESTEVDADEDRHAEPVLRYCVPAEAGGEYVLQVEMVSGFGEFGVGIFVD